MVKYIIKPSKKQTIFDFLSTMYSGEKLSRVRVIVAENKPRTITRWAKWLPFDLIDSCLMEEHEVEIIPDDTYKVLTESKNLEEKTDGTNISEINFEELGI